MANEQIGASQPAKDRSDGSELAVEELDEVAGGGGQPHMDVEQTLNIGSASSGAGASKITFNPF